MLLFQIRVAPISAPIRPTTPTSTAGLPTEFQKEYLTMATNTARCAALGARLCEETEYHTGSGVMVYGNGRESHLWTSTPCKHQVQVVSTFAQPLGLLSTFSRCCFRKARARVWVCAYSRLGCSSVYFVYFKPELLCRPRPPHRYRFTPTDGSTSSRHRLKTARVPTPRSP